MEHGPTRQTLCGTGGITAAILNTCDLFGPGLEGSAVKAVSKSGQWPSLSSQRTSALWWKSLTKSQRAILFRIYAGY